MTADARKSPPMVMFIAVTPVTFDYSVFAYNWSIAAKVGSLRLAT
jgi:hypothetical protein